MEFEFDPDKSVSNRRKHGIDFLEAEALWSDPDAVESPARTVDFDVQGEDDSATRGRSGTEWGPFFAPNRVPLGESSTRGGWTRCPRP